MRRIAYWADERLPEWQLWYFKAPGGARSSFYVERVDCASVFGTLTPEINDRALVTDQLVAGLPDPLKRVVKAVYLDGIGNSMDGIANRLGLSKRTLHDRLCHADMRLDLALSAMEEKRISRLSSGMLKSGSLGRAAS